MVDQEQPMTMHPRLYADGEPVAAIPTVEGRIDDVALELLAADSSFNADSFAWVGSEFLGGGIFCASVYTGRRPDSPYLWVTAGDDEQFLACVYVGGVNGEEAEDPFLVAECSADDLAAESLRMLDSAQRFGGLK